MSSLEIAQINSIKTRTNIQDRIKAIENHGCTLELDDAVKPVFKNNLALVDSLLPQIIRTFTYILLFRKR
jgi:hypothetical protein